MVEKKQFNNFTINHWWSKGLVEEKDLRIPNMRGIMTARTKPLTVIEPVDANVKQLSLKTSTNQQ
jgi:hypothetical protein